MKYLKIIIIVLLPVSFVLGGMVTYYGSREAKAEVAEEVPAEVDEFALLVDYLNTRGHYLSMPNPEDSLSVTASELNTHVGNKAWHIVDLRNAEDFYPAHISGAVHVEQNLVYEYMRSLPLHLIDKVVMVCYAGQRASYVTGLLRLLGHDKVYFLRYGMSSWTHPIARDNWLSSASNRFAGRLSVPFEVAATEQEVPVIFTFKTTPNEILEARIFELLQEDFANARVRADEMLADPLQFFTVLADPAVNPGDNIAIEGSVWLSGDITQNLTANLGVFPAFTPIVVTSLNGQSGSLLAAFLRTIGYDARFLSFGLSALAVNALQAKNYPVFSTREIKNLPTQWAPTPVVAAAPATRAAGC